MVYSTFTPPLNPDDKMSVKLRQTILEGDTGEYVQRAEAGINNKKYDIDPKWTNTTYAEATAILTFLKNLGRSTPFWYAAPEEPSRLYFCDDLSYEWKKGRRCDISCKFIHTVLP